jgi:ferritin-like protein
MAHEGLHEPRELLDEETIDRHRAYVSLTEELEAIDWYDQRINATNDAELIAVLTNSRDDEKEHAAMTLEWLRRHDAPLDQQLRKFLFTSGPVNAGGETTSNDDASADPSDHSLGIASLKGTE